MQRHPLLLATLVVTAVFSIASFAQLTLAATTISTNISTGGNLTVSGTAGITGLTTLGNASTTQLTTTGSTYLATTGGNVGIGTTNPEAMLHLEANYSDEMVTNGSFTTDLTGWAGANWSWSSGTALHTTGVTTALTQVGCVAEVGETYKVTFTVSGRSAGMATLSFGGISIIVGDPLTDMPGDGTYTEYLTTVNINSLQITPTSTFNGSIDNVSVLKVSDGGMIIAGPTDLRGSVTVHDGITFPFSIPVRIGYHAGKANQADTYIKGNTFVGHNSGQANTTGEVTAFGQDTCYSNTTGKCLAVGHDALTSNTTGNGTAVGKSAGLLNTTGYFTGMGYGVGQNNTTGNLTGFGHYAGFSNTTGNLIAIGFLSGYGATPANAPVTDTYGILIGDNANRSVISSTVLTNYIGIGNGVLIDKSNQVKIGNSSITETLLYGNVGIGTTTPDAKLQVYGGDTATSTVEIGGASNTTKGACLKLRDIDGAGWTYCTTLNGTMSCSVTSCE